MNTLPKDPVVFSFYTGLIQDRDKPLLLSIKKVLDQKLNSGDDKLDIKKLAYFANATELVARQYLTYLESQVYYQRKFTIINGAKEFEKIDAIRAAALQERAASQNQ